MHASIWRFNGDPDELLRRCEAMLGEIPAVSRRLHLCLRGPDGIVLVDTCPTLEAFEAFASDPFAALRAGPARAPGARRLRGACRVRGRKPRRRVRLRRERLQARVHRPRSRDPEFDRRARLLHPSPM